MSTETQCDKGHHERSRPIPKHSTHPIPPHLKFLLERLCLGELRCLPSGRCLCLAHTSGTGPPSQHQYRGGVWEQQECKTNGGGNGEGGGLGGGGRGGS